MMSLRPTSSIGLHVRVWHVHDRFGRSIERTLSRVRDDADDRPFDRRAVKRKAQPLPESSIDHGPAPMSSRKSDRGS